MLLLRTINEHTAVLITYNQPTIVPQCVTVNHAVFPPIGILFLVVSGSVLVLCVKQAVWCREQAFWYSLAPVVLFYSCFIAGAAEVKHCSIVNTV